MNDSSRCMKFKFHFPQIKFYWRTAVPTPLYIVEGWFCPIAAEFIRCNGGRGAHKS